MRQSRFKEEQIVAILHQAENGISTGELTRKLGISEATFYRWKKKYSGMGTGEIRRLKQLEQENRRLKSLVVDLSLDKAMLQDVLRKKPCINAELFILRGGRYTQRTLFAVQINL